MSSQMQLQLSEQYDAVGVNEFVGYLDFNVQAKDSFILQGIQDIYGKILASDIWVKETEFIVHSHPRLKGHLSKWFCFPSEQDFRAKEFFGGKPMYLYCGDVLIKF
jgi:hypothetical protein